MLGSLFLVIKKYGIRKNDFIINFHHFQIQSYEIHLFLMIKIVERHRFHHSGEKNLDGKDSWIFGAIPHNTCNFIMQSISSFL